MIPEITSSVRARQAFNYLVAAMPEEKVAEDG
jgi:hypothetical protein